MAENFTKVFDIISETKGDILDVGYGWGVSSNHFYSNGVKSLTIIEKRKDVYQKALEWAKDKPNVHLHFGDWIDIIPSLNKKFDGIYMDTISPENENFSKNKTKEEYDETWKFYHSSISEEKWEKYKSFEEYAKLISKENCILCIFEYVKFRKDLNKESLQIYWGTDKTIPKLHDIGFTYFVANEFRKDKFYDSKQILTNKFCKRLILDNKDNLKFYKGEKEIDNILHKRNFKFTKLNYNKEFEDLLNSNFFTNYKKVNLKDIWCGMFEYNEGDGYDRHVETIKGLSLDDDEQYNLIYDFTLNDDYEGGEVEIYDEWYKNDRETFSEVKPKVGECLIYKPYQHVTYKKITKNKKYQILVVTKNKDLNQKLI
tara:strand:+ start:2115 stop:3227 length:1113 start_codon:yes stop_codon:yes gene_type:complete